MIALFIGIEINEDEIEKLSGSLEPNSFKQELSRKGNLYYLLAHVTLPSHIFQMVLGHHFGNRINCSILFFLIQNSELPAKINTSKLVEKFKNLQKRDFSTLTNGCVISPVSLVAHTMLRTFSTDFESSSASLSPSIVAVKSSSPFCNVWKRTTKKPSNEILQLKSKIALSKQNYSVT